MKKGRWGNKRLEMDLGESAGKKARSNLPEMRITTFTVVIHCVSNGKDFALAPKQLQASYTDVRHWGELFDFIDKNGSPKAPYLLTSKFKCTLEQDELEEEYMGLYTPGQMINDPTYGQISYNYCIWNGLKSKLGPNVKILLVEMMRVTGKEIAEHRIRPRKVIPAHCVKASCEHLVIIIYRLWKVLKRVDKREKRRERRMVGKRMILVSM